jgi:hypothetical protein
LEPAAVVALVVHALDHVISHSSLQRCDLAAVALEVLEAK